MSLWISAFEAIAHPGTTDVELSYVKSIIEKVPWRSPRLKYANYIMVTKKSKRKKANNRKVILPIQVYSRVYNTRNMYLHGTPLPPNQLEFKTRKTWNPLKFQVPALYRCSILSELSHNGFGSYPKVEYPDIYEGILFRKPEEFHNGEVHFA